VNNQSPDLPSGSPRYAINRAIVDLCRNPNARTLIADKVGFFSVYPLSSEERQAVLGAQWRRLLELGVLPNLVYRFYMLHGFAPESFPAAVGAKN
jgi:Aromatic-ring-opening dioxygenase LigAB, LigA subunit